MLIRNTIVYRPWQPGDDDAVLAFRPNTNENWFRHKFDDEDLEPEGIRLAFLGKRVVGHVMGERTTLYIEGKVQEFGEVMDVFVAPDLRRQGIATRLMQEVHTYFERKGYRGSILDPAESARRLYQNLDIRRLPEATYFSLTSPLFPAKLNMMFNKYLGNSTFPQAR